MARLSPSKTADSRRGRPPVASPMIAAVTRLRPADRARIDHIASRMGIAPTEAMREAIRIGARELVTGRAAPGEAVFVATPEGYTEIRVHLGPNESELRANIEALIAHAAAARIARAARLESRCDTVSINFESVERIF